MRNPAAWTMMYHGWFDADISDSAKLTIWAIYSFFNQQTREWIEIPTVERVAQLRKLKVRVVKDHYQELEAAGLIRRQRTPLMGGGSVLKIEIIEPSRDNPTYLSNDSEGAENCTLRRCKELHPPKVQKIAPSIKNNTVNPKTSSPPQNTSYSSSSNENPPTTFEVSPLGEQEPEPFEAVPSEQSQTSWANRVSNLRGYSPAIGQKRPKVSFTDDIEGKLPSYFEAFEISEIRTIVTQQQAETPGFMEEVLEMYSNWRHKTNKIGAFVKTLRTLWNDGDYKTKEQRSDDRIQRILRHAEEKKRLTVSLNKDTVAILDKIGRKTGV